ncbi:MAG: tetratricopeptide repeat protein [Cohaesibacteraceae bacterium]|nr:tetratricopeptide repeat protein [Cohaesibacteraceae bacterium]
MLRNQRLFSALFSCLLVSTMLLFASSVHSAETQRDREMERVLSDLPITFSGSYLSALLADEDQDFDLAARFYRDALSVDPDNPILVHKLFVATIVSGNMEEGFQLAENLVKNKPDHQLARLILGVKALKGKSYRSAQKHFGRGRDGDSPRLPSVMLSAWADVALRQADKGIEKLELVGGPQWHALFTKLHAGLMADLSGDLVRAERFFRDALEIDKNSPRKIEAFARFLARNDRRDEALKTISIGRAWQRNPVLRQLHSDISADKKISPFALNARSGASQFLAGLGAILIRDNMSDLSALYLQLAVYLDETNDMALFSLGNAFGGMRKKVLAIEVYERVPQNSALKLDARIQIGLDLHALKRSDEAIENFRALLKTRPDNLDVLQSLGDILRGTSKFEQAAEIYSRAIDTAAKGQPESWHWVLRYYRGISFERSGEWGKAEPDFLKALEISPDQPLVLNYLGYSWVERGENLDRGLEMLRTAVKKRPNDAFIIDSLGWALFKLKRFDEAVVEIERSVELMPTEATIVDHLGDSYFRVGRILEAHYQWKRALELGPETDKAKAELEVKIVDGMPDLEPQEKAAIEPKEPDSTSN